MSQQLFPPTSSLFERARFEIMPFRGIEEEARVFPKGTILAMTSSPRKTFETTIVLIEQLASSGYKMCPHIAARSVRDREQLSQIANRLFSNGFDEVFIIGGDVPKPAGTYDSALPLIRDLVEMQNHPKRIGISGYPEGHPLISKDDLLETLREKQKYADYMVTQICFDPDRIGSWLTAMRDQGITLPAYIGIPGVLKRQKLLEISMRVGVGESSRFLIHNVGMFARLLRQDLYTPDSLVAGIANLARESKLTIAGLHIYTFNQCQTTEQWHQKMLKKR
jgi:methylenetetrahydrofolate reductase (NADPH)